MRRRSFTRQTLLIPATVLALASACSTTDDDGTSAPDATATGNPDARPMVFADARPMSTPDSGVMRPDTGPTGQYCAMGGNVTVDGDQVPVGTTSAQTTAGSNPAILGCIDEPTQQRFGRIRIESCLSFVGGSTTATAEELDQLQIDVFRTADMMGNLIDPTFSATTGVDRQPAARENITIVLNRNSVACDSGIQAEIGTAEDDNINTATFYTIRLRNQATSTTAGSNPVWATSYHSQVSISPTSVVGGSPSDCTPQTCTGLVDLIAVRAAPFSAEVQAAGGSIAGADNLFDQVGDGHALVVASDCSRQLMSGAVAGSLPSAKASGYMVNGAFDANATVTDNTGVWVGLGYDTTTAAPTSAKVAVGVQRNANSCTEEFNGSEVQMYPDGITVFRSSVTTVLHAD